MSLHPGSVIIVGLIIFQWLDYNSIAGILNNFRLKCYFLNYIKLLTDGAVAYEQNQIVILCLSQGDMSGVIATRCHGVLISHLYHYLSEPSLTARNVLFLAALQISILTCPAKPLCRYVGGWRAQQQGFFCLCFPKAPSPTSLTAIIHHYGAWAPVVGEKTLNSTASSGTASCLTTHTHSGGRVNRRGGCCVRVQNA